MTIYYSGNGQRGDEPERVLEEANVMLIYAYATPEGRQRNRLPRLLRQRTQARAETTSATVGLGNQTSEMPAGAVVSPAKCSTSTADIVPGQMLDLTDRSPANENAIERFVERLPDVTDQRVEASILARQAVEAGRGKYRTDEEADAALRELDAETPWERSR